MCPCGEPVESRSCIVGDCEIYKEERDKLDMREIDERGMGKVGTLLIDISEVTIAIVRDRWWPHTTKQDGVEICKTLLLNI